MPLTKKGKKIMKSMKDKYGDKKGESVFYASANKGKIKNVHGKKDGGKVKKVFPTNPSREQEARDYYTRKFGSKKAKAELGAKTRDRRKVKKVQGKLKKASRAHANQSKILGSLLKNGKKKKKRS